jgi:xanthine/uracil/vitamin C permease (AzgA family)
LILVIQGFWKTRTYFNFAGRRDSRIGSYERAVNHWGGVHIALSIVVTIFVAIHGAFFLHSLAIPSLAIWFGAGAFVVLIGTNLSGLLTESRRKLRQFGPFKRWHVTLMLAVLTLTFIHVEGLISGSFVRSILGGAIVGFVGALAVVIIVTLTDRPN